MSNPLFFFTSDGGLWFLLVTFAFIYLFWEKRSTTREAIISVVIGMLLSLPSIVFVYYESPSMYLDPFLSTVFNPSSVVRFVAILAVMSYLLGVTICVWLISYERLSNIYNISKRQWWKNSWNWERKR